MLKNAILFKNRAFSPLQSPICVAFFLKWGKHIITLYCYARVNFQTTKSTNYVEKLERGRRQLPVSVARKYVAKLAFLTR